MQADAQEQNTTICDTCGRFVATDEALTVYLATGGVGTVCSEECAHAHGLGECPECGDWFNPLEPFAVITDEASYCSEECAIDAGLTRCQHCDEWFEADSAETIELYDRGVYHCYCCENCASAAGARQCDSCGEWVADIDELRYCEANDEYVCDDCYQQSYEYCDCCSEVVPRECFNFGLDMCDACAECSNDLHEYGYSPELTFYGNTKGDSVPFLGVELETDQDYTDKARRHKYCADLAAICGSDRIYLTKDSSLDCGVEITSHPMTLDEHLGCGVWEGVRSVAIDHEFSSHDNRRCGLHIHINRSFFGKSDKRQEVGGYNLGMLVSRMEKQLTQFSRRKSNDWCEYGIHKDYLGKDKRRDFPTMFVKSKHMCGKTNHSQCVNYQHSSTFELRIFRGTLRLKTLYASMALTHGLARAAKLHSQTWCESVDWYTLTTWILADLENNEARAALKNYLDSRGLA